MSDKAKLMLLYLVLVMVGAAILPNMIYCMLYWLILSLMLLFMESDLNG